MKISLLFPDQSLKFNKRSEEIKSELSAAGEKVLIPFSSQTGLGVDEVKKQIEEALTNV